MIPAVPTTAPEMQPTISPTTQRSGLKESLARLAEPFDLDVISWKPQVTSYKDPENPKAKGAAYADQRAYTDRLNELFGPQGWTREYSVYTQGGLEREVRVGSERKSLSGQAKVFVVARVIIQGIGVQTGTGESWIDDDNAFTSAEAQAFKRACVCFGLGRYLYDLPETEWLPIDKYSKQFKIAPPLPDWAVPKRKLCQSCANLIKDRTINKVHYTAQTLAQRGRDLYGMELCADCQIDRAKVQQHALPSRLAQPQTAP